MREDLKQRLYSIAIERIRQRNYSLSSVAEESLTEFINRGVDNMTTADYASESRRKVAEENILKLIDQLTGNKQARQLNESLDYYAFSSAQKSICPLWPFC